MELGIVKRVDIKVGQRFREDYGDIKELAHSMVNEGIVQPLAVKRCTDGTYVLLAGGRRMKAAESANIEEIPVRIYTQDLTELEMRVIELVENVIRKDMNWLEQTRLRKEIHELQTKIHGRKVSKDPEAPGWTQQKTAEMLGLKQTMVSEEIKLAQAIEAFPALKEAKTRDEAVKMLKKMGDTMLRKQLTEKIEAQNAATPQDQQKTKLCNSYIVADFFDVVSRLPANSIDMCEIDPPYAIDLMNIKRKQDVGIYNEEAYNEIEAADYLYFIERVLTECHRVMTDSSWLVLWFAIEPWIEEMYNILVRTGFETRRIVGLWVKDQGQTMSPTKHLANCYEPFFYARKGSPNLVKQGRSNIFHYRAVPPQKKVHPTERPIEMIQEVLGTFCMEGSRILVPFLGSGNTLLAANNLNMVAFGTDLSQEYKDGFVVKVHTGQIRQYKSY